MNWTVEDSKKVYGVGKWGSPFVSINPKGHVFVSDNIETSTKNIDLYELTKDLESKGVRLPVLVRFPDILKERIESLFGCFNHAIKESDYKGIYKGVYPVKVNQEKHLIEDLVKLGDSLGMGLECGSKPELLIALSKMNSTNGLIICNGFKDYDYIEMALLSKKIGKNTIIVIDRYSELDLIIKAYKEHGVKPSIGFRAKLFNRGSGKWAESSGSKSKFGLTPPEMVEATNRLKEEGLLDCLELLHYHIGSQVPAIQDIKTALKEGGRFYAELFGLGAQPKYLDVGGGLGVNYDGTGSSDNSVNYSDQEYANDVIYTIKAICQEKSIPHPNIITESGRALVAHCSALIFNVLGSNNTQNSKTLKDISETDHQVLRDLDDVSKYLKESTLLESYNDLNQIRRDVLQLFSYGVLNLSQRAQAELMMNNFYLKIRKIAKESKDNYSDLIHELDSFLCETYFCNFSLFQSLPDSWAMDQVFPVLPLHRHNEEPQKRAVLVDLTCDSDGTIDKFIDPTTSVPQNYLEVHDVKKDEPYYIGVFLTGAYQEILGDMHNLFGDTDAVHVAFKDNGEYEVVDFVKGDSISEMLNYVSYEPEKLIESLKKTCRDCHEAKKISGDQADILMNKFEASLSHYTYLNEIN